VNAPSDTKPHVLVVDDDRAVRESLRRSLEFNGYAVSLAEDGASALAGISSTNPDAIVMDVMMPRLDGIETTKSLRKAGNDVPILVLTARDAIGDRVEGLDAGADDYLTKPFGAPELMARIRAHLRKREHGGSVAIESVFRFGEVTIDFLHRRVTRQDQVVHLTPIEYRLLTTLVRNAGKVLTHTQLLREVWGPGHAERSHYLRIYMGHLRQKLESDPARPSHIFTETGVGYRLVLHNF
jgi:DNA-binding response OmpR family regulator